MTSTQKLIIILILINTIGSIITEVNMNPLDYTTSGNVKIRALANEHKNESEYLDEMETTPKEQNLETEGSIGDTFFWGLKIIGIVAKGLLPLPYEVGNVRTQAEKTLIDVLYLFKWLFMVLVIIEGYMVIKNKKQS